MKPKFVTFNNGVERYIINVNDISTVVLSEFENALITITSMDGTMTEIKVVDDDIVIANNIIDGIINAINSDLHMYEIKDVG